MQNDLHVHSNESDGKLAPELLIEAAVRNGVSVIALCDHDTTAGVERFTRYGEVRGIKALAGIELSAKWRGRSCHVLGIGGDSEHIELAIMENHDGRNNRILEKLAKFGINISAEQLKDEAGCEAASRQQIAGALLKAGYVNSLQEAFDKYLSRDTGLAYTDGLDPADAVKLLRDAGAFAILAHPRRLESDENGLFDLLTELKKAGLQGVEVYYPETTDEQILLYREMARKLKLVQTGGSDFHWPGKGENIGYYRPSTPIPKITIPELGI